MKKLYRIREGKVLAGVCTGLGDYFMIDPVFIRVLFIVFTFTGGAGFITYLILWAVMPERDLFLMDIKSPEGQKPISEIKQPFDATEIKENSNFIIGVVLVTLGAIFLADNLLPFFSFKDTWPFVLIVAGGLLLWNTLRKKDSANGGNSSGT